MSNRRTRGGRGDDEDVGGETFADAVLACTFEEEEEEEEEEEGRLLLV